MIECAITEDSFCSFTIAILQWQQYEARYGKLCVCFLLEVAGIASSEDYMCLHVASTLPPPPLPPSLSLCLLPVCISLSLSRSLSQQSRLSIRHWYLSAQYTVHVYCNCFDKLCLCVLSICRHFPNSVFAICCFQHKGVLHTPINIILPVWNVICHTLLKFVLKFKINVLRIFEIFVRPLFLLC